MLLLRHTILRGTFSRKLNLVPIYGVFGFESLFFSHHCLFSRYYSAKNHGVRDPHEVLGLHKRASKKEIKSAYIRLSKLYHPDRNQANPSQAALEFNELREAYEDLLTRQIEIYAEQERSDPSHCQGERHNETYNSSEYNTYSHSTQGRRKSKARSIDDWIKEVERNARIKKQQAKYGAYKNKSSSQDKDGYHYEHGNNRYNYTTSKAFDGKCNFWKPSESMEKNYSQCETRFLSDIDRLVKYFTIKDRLQTEVGSHFAERGISKFMLIYILFIKFLFRLGGKLLLCLVAFLFVVEMSCNDKFD